MKTSSPNIYIYPLASTNFIQNSPFSLKLLSHSHYWQHGHPQLYSHNNQQRIKNTAKQPDYQEPEIQKP